MVVIAHALIVEFLGGVIYRVGFSEGSLESCFESPAYKSEFWEFVIFEGEIRFVASLAVPSSYDTA